jgi:hypothetical protein
MQQITLKVDDQDVQAAERIAREHGTDVAGLFSRLVRAIMAARPPLDENELAPLTRKAMGIIRVPEGKSDRELVEEAIIEKHGLEP